MPELPEVETVCRGMRDELLGKKVVSLWKSDKNLRFPLNIEDASGIIGQKITYIKRRAKYIIIGFKNKNSLIIHLGMTGQISFEKENLNIKKHDHFYIEFFDKFYMKFHDARRFGFVIYDQTANIYKHRLLKDLAPEPLIEYFNSEYLFTLLKSSNKAIKEAIMNNRIVVGVGNIYASESLFRANIHPEIKAKNITRHQMEKLVSSIKDVLQEAIDAGGSSINDYVKSNGELGYFQLNFNVYNRENLPCKICENKIIKIKQAGRSSYFCPNCQKY